MGLTVVAIGAFLLGAFGIGPLVQEYVHRDINHAWIDVVSDKGWIRVFTTDVTCHDEEWGEVSVNVQSDRLRLAAFSRPPFKADPDCSSQPSRVPVGAANPFEYSRCPNVTIPLRTTLGLDLLVEGLSFYSFRRIELVKAHRPGSINAALFSPRQNSSMAFVRLSARCPHWDP